jgi:ADP-ribose pyrophosphatase YjhB (NUDIX family)
VRLAFPENALYVVLERSERYTSLMPYALHVSTVIPDGNGRVLLVKETKPINVGKWNLPGGHREVHETIWEAALREVREEVHLEVTLTALLGVYAVGEAVRFGYLATPTDGTPVAGDDIAEVRWWSAEEIAATPDAELVAPDSLLQILADWQFGRRFPLEVIRPR